MYLIRRVWETQPREAKKAASIASAIGKVYHEAGRRSPVRVYFNGGSLPGDRDRVYMEWTADVIDSPYGTDQESLPETKRLGAMMRELTTETWIEFYELMTDAKAVDFDA